MASSKVQPVVTDDDTPVVRTTAHQTVLDSIASMRRDTSDVSEKIMAGILTADTADDVFAQTDGGAATLEHAEDWFGVPLRVTAVSLNESRYTEGSPAYAVLDVTNLRDGKSFTMGCGAGNVVAGLIRLHSLGALPVDIVIFESVKQTANGYNVIQMRRATDADKDTSGKF